MSLVSVDLRVFIFCLLDPVMGISLPKDTHPSVCYLILECTHWDPSDHHLRTGVELTLSVSANYGLPQRYRIILVRFPQSSSSYSFTLVARKATVVEMSGLA